jgi:hypothetical protein
MRRVVYVLLVTQIVDNEITTSVGPVFWDRLDAHRALQGFPYADNPNAHAQIVERQVRGEQPQMRTAQAGQA